MAEQRVGRCTTAAGQPVAYATVGHGPALLYEYGWLSHLQHEWVPGPFRDHLDRLAAALTVLRVDKPGFGLAGGSSIPDHETAVAALLAAADAVGLKKFALRGDILGGATAIALAATHPERVARLVLYGAHACGEDAGGAAAIASLQALARTHWGLGSRLLADLWMAGADPEAVEWFARLQREIAGPEAAAAVIGYCMGTDVRALAGQVRAPTLIVHREHDRAVPLSAAQRLAELIPGARLVVVPGRAHLPWVADANSVLEPILRFLGVRAGRRAHALSPREQEVAQMVAQGLTNAAIASRLGIAQRTAEAHVEHILDKLALRSRAQVAAWAVGRNPDARRGRGA